MSKPKKWKPDAAERVVMAELVGNPIRSTICALLEYVPGVEVCYHAAAVRSAGVIRLDTADGQPILRLERPPHDDAWHARQESARLNREREAREAHAAVQADALDAAIWWAGAPV